MAAIGDAIIHIGGDTTTNSLDDVVMEWERCFRGNENAQSFKRKGKIQKVPTLLLKSEEGYRHRAYYVPIVVSLGPYYHNQNDLALAEKYKLVTLQEYCLSSRKTVDVLYNKLFEVVHDARNCYIDGSTDDYNDEQFNQMMLRDGCFILYFLEYVASNPIKYFFLTNEYLGALGSLNVVRDILLLENQIPFLVLEVLLNLKYPNDEGEKILNQFFKYINGGVVATSYKKVFEKNKPLHLLEVNRACFISLPAFDQGLTNSSLLGRLSTKGVELNEDYDNAGLNPFASVMELKAKGIFVKSNKDKYSRNDKIKFSSCWCYGELQLMPRVLTEIGKVLYLNMIAYELCPHNPNDFRVSTYILIMKSLITHPDDVKELRKNKVIMHFFRKDEDVVKMYSDIKLPVINFKLFVPLQRAIEKHYNNKYRTGVAEVISVYFGSPWKAVASFAAISALLVTCVQTYFTINPLRHSN